jgi:FkbM family methyltransferase
VPPAAAARATVLRVLRQVLGERAVHRIGRFARRVAIGRRGRVVSFRGVQLELDPGSANSESVLAGRFERPLLDFVLPRLRPGDCCLDVGAHVGYWAVPLAAAVGPAGRVVAVEAHQPNVARLEANLARNGLANTEVRHAAAGATTGRAQLRVSSASSSWNSVVGSGTYFDDAVSLVDVPAVALDDLELPEDLALVKIDVEGAEEQVVAGAAELLRRTRMLVMEVGGERVTSAAYVASVTELLFGGFDQVLAVDKSTGTLVSVGSRDDFHRRWTDVADVTKVVALRDAEPAA